MTSFFSRACSGISLKSDERLGKKRKTCSVIIANHKMVVDCVRGWTTIRTQLRENLVILGESNFSMTLLSTYVCTSPPCTVHRDVLILLLTFYTVSLGL